MVITLLDFESYRNEAPSDKVAKHNQDTSKGEGHLASPFKTSSRYPSCSKEEMRVVGGGWAHDDDDRSFRRETFTVALYVDYPTTCEKILAKGSRKAQQTDGKGSLKYPNAKIFLHPRSQIPNS